MPLLQLALDDLDLDTACSLVTDLAALIDVVEAGTPLIKRYGMDAVRRLRQVAPQKLLVADMKTMDAGALEANLAFDAGADIISVLGCAGNRTIQAALEVAEKRQKSLAADLLGVADKPTRARQLAQMGVHYISVHTGSDDQKSGDTPLSDLADVRRAVDCAIMVAGGITAQTIPGLLHHKPDVLIVGSAITKASDPLTVTQQIYNAIRQNQG